jgi:hypothetical protein
MDIEPISEDELRMRLSWDMLEAPLTRDQLMSIVEIINE